MHPRGESCLLSGTVFVEMVILAPPFPCHPGWGGASFRVGFLVPSTRRRVCVLLQGAFTFTTHLAVYYLTNSVFYHFPGILKSLGTLRDPS